MALTQLLRETLEEVSQHGDADSSAQAKTMLRFAGAQAIFDAMQAHADVQTRGRIKAGLDPYIGQVVEGTF